MQTSDTTRQRTPAPVPVSAEEAALVSGAPLFAGIKPDEVAAILGCMGGRMRRYETGELIFHTGDPVRSMGIVATGTVRIEQTDAWGRRSILSQAGPGNTFAEAYACSREATMGVDVVAASDVTILFLEVDRVLRTCGSACSFHTTLIRNLLTVMSERNLALSRKITDISPRTIRERLLSYLSSQAHLQKATRRGQRFCVPFTRQQLADYLRVDRSALSHELAKMQAEGIVRFEGNEFWLEKTPL